MDIYKKYAEKIQSIIDNDTIGDYTWIGLLVEFTHEYESEGL